MNDRRITILIATPLYPPDTGGPATDTAMLRRELPKQGIDVVVCSFGTVRHLPRGIRHVKYMLNLFKHTRDVNAIVAMDTFSVCLPALIVAKLSRKPLVVRVPGDFAWEQAVQRFNVIDSIELFQKKRYGWRVELIRSFEWFAVRQADLVMAISDFFKNIIEEWGVEPTHLVRVYLGLDVPEEVTMPPNVPEGKILFSLGRFVPWKGFSMLIELVSELPDEWQLVLAGDGPLRSTLEAQARSLGVADRVTFTGSVPHAEALGWYRAANVFALNTSFESFSFQMIEAMASGVPVIATTAGSLPELVENGIEGVLCAPNDKEAFKEAVLSVKLEEDVWKKRVKAAKHKAQRFSAEASTREFATALKKLCV